MFERVLNTPLNVSIPAELSHATRKFGIPLQIYLKSDLSQIYAPSQIVSVMKIFDNWGI